MSGVVLFVHSTGTGPAMWSGLARALPAGFEVRTPSLHGYPPNPLAERGRGYTAEEDAELLVESVKDVTGPLHVVAHSYGGLVAYKLARKRPVASFWLFEPVLFGALRQEPQMDPEAKKEVSFFFDTPSFLEDQEAGGRDAWLEVFVDYWNKPGSFARMPAPMKDAMRAWGWKMFQEVRGTALDPDRFEAYRTNIPTTIVTGEKTTPSARAMAHALADQDPNVRLEVVPGATHMSIVMQGDRFAPSLAAHLARQRA